MTDKAPRTLEAQRLALCERLQTQREVLARQLGGSTGRVAEFPRSATMRLLTRHPQAVIRTFGALAMLFRRR